MKTVYLSGPITGTSYGEATDWRMDVQDKLLKGIVGLSPMRGKAYLAKELRIKVAYDGVNTPLSSASAIALRDFYDCTHCDVVLAYLPKSLKKDDGHLSYGTICEMAWAKASGIPVILVTDDEDCTHPIIAANVTHWAKSLDDAVLLINGIFGAYADGY